MLERMLQIKQQQEQDEISCQEIQEEPALAKPKAQSVRTNKGNEIALKKV